MHISRKAERGVVSPGTKLWKAIRGRACSVENPYSHNHYVMCNGPQDDLAALAPVLPRPQRRAEPPLDHRVDRLRLPPLPVLPLVLAEPLLHPPPPTARRRLVGGPPALRRDDRADAMRPDAAVDPLGIEIGVGQQRTDPGAADGLAQRPPELHQVGPRAAPRHGGEDHVASAIDHEDDLDRK